MVRQPVLVIPLNRMSSVSLQDQLSDGLKQRIRSGMIAPGASLPSTRELATDLGVSRNTVVNAYDRLLGEGYLESRPRSGVFVNSEFPGTNRAPLILLNRPSPERKRPDQNRPGASRSVRRVFRKLRPEMKLWEPIPFRPCQPDVRLFPLSLWNRIRSRVLRSTGTTLLNYQSRHTLGLPSLRQALARYLNESRGVRCQWQQIAITCGSQQALFLLSQLLLKAGDRVLMEDPGYFGARQAFERIGARLIRMEIDESGAVPPGKFVPARVIYTTPSRQFPTGVSTPVSRRLQILETARAARAWLLEDDYDSEFRYSRPPLPSLHSLDGNGRTIYLGSMSKVLFPSLRIGYIVLPEELIPSFESLRLIVEDHGPLIDQATLAEFLESGSFYTHIRRCRKAYSARLDAFLTAMDQHQVPLRFPNTDGGMNQAGYFLDAEINAEKVSSKLAESGIDVPPISRYCIGRHPPALVFGFTAFDPKRIRSAVAQVAPVLRDP